MSSIYKFPDKKILPGSQLKYILHMFEGQIKFLVSKDEVQHICNADRRCARWISSGLILFTFYLWRIGLLIEKQIWKTSVNVILYLETNVFGRKKITTVFGILSTSVAVWLQCPFFFFSTSIDSLVVLLGVLLNLLLINFELNKIFLMLRCQMHTCSVY